jgi:hypothetical protein
LILCKLDHKLTRPDESKLLPSDMLDESRVSSQSLNVTLELLDAYSQVLKLLGRRCVFGERAAELGSSVRVDGHAHRSRGKDYRKDYSIYEKLSANPVFDCGSNCYGRSRD